MIRTQTIVRGCRSDLYAASPAAFRSGSFLEKRSPSPYAESRYQHPVWAKDVSLLLGRDERL
jgi:hypothetical protein